MKNQGEKKKAKTKIKSNNEIETIFKLESPELNDYIADLIGLFIFSEYNTDNKSRYR